MADHLPLIPSRNGGCEAGVRGVVRGVLRAACVLPPLQSCACAPPAVPPAEGPPPPEAELQEQRARRLARPEPRHPYRARGPPGERPARTLPEPLLSRTDLMPAIQQYATRDASLWVRNVLGRSAEDVRPLGSDSSLYSLSAARLPVRAPPPPRPTESSELGGALSEGSLTPPGEFIVCEPDTLQFVNFTLDQLHTACVRVVNMSMVEVRVAVRPPAHAALNVELLGRTAVTSGAHLDLRVHFLPRNVRALTDRVLLRASHGRDVELPIACYMQPPTLNVLVPNMTSLLSCVGAGGGVVGSAGGAGWGAAGAPGEVLDLGARLLGDVHSICLVLDSDASHAAFFLLTEDAWQSRRLSEVSSGGALVSGSWAVWPAWFRGGGRARGAACCRAAGAGLHSAALRVLSSTAVARPLHLLADSIYYHPDHVTLQAQSKTYDICSESDDACEYYVHLGTAFQRQRVSASVTLYNHSPVTYSYYWSMRAWGKCSCWREQELGEEEEQSEPECAGARERAARWRQGDPSDRSDDSEEDGAACCVEPSYGALPPRSERVVNISVTDVGDRVGTHRLVLVLVLKDIPFESFPPGFMPSIVSIDGMKTECIPGLGERVVRVAAVAALQLEVWWCVCRRVVAVSPRYMELARSRRVRTVPLAVQAALLHPGGVARARWRVGEQTEAEAVVLHPQRPVVVSLPLELPDVPDDYPVEREITLEAEGGEWREAVRVAVAALSRAARLQPALGWLGVVLPGAPLAATLTLHNDTHQDTYWWADVRRWLGENPPRPVCVGRAPCETCHEASCTCAMLRPTRGKLAQDAAVDLLYSVNSPTRDGCVVSVVRARRSAADTGPALPAAPPALARASLLAYRVLAPRLQLLVKPCNDTCPCGAGCGVSGGEAGRALWRAERALVMGSRVCCRLLLRNMTPLPTRLVWDQYDDKNDALRVTFKPNEFDVAGFEEVEVTAVVWAARVCGRQVWARRALVQHAYEPLYLLFEAAIEGVELECWLPLPTAYVRVYRKEREKFPWSPPLPSSPAECFAYDLDKRIKLRLCKCQKQLVYVEPPRRRRPEPPAIDRALYLDVVDSRPVLHWTCECHGTCRPLPPLEEPFVLQFREVPLKTVKTMSIRLRSRGKVAAHWSASSRLGAKPARPKLNPEEVWSSRVLNNGSCTVVHPTRGVLGSGAVQDINISVYADTWGIYRNQILIQTEHLEPLVVDMWVEAVGSPLHFPLQQLAAPEPPVMWMSRADSSHTLRTRNTSRVDLLVRAYVLREHDVPADALPLRLYYRLLDVPPVECPCTHIYDMESDSNLSTEMDTQVELYLGPDYGYQDTHYYQMIPEEQRVCAGGWGSWQVSAVPPPPPPPPRPAAPAPPPPAASASVTAARSACTYLSDYSLQPATSTPAPDDDAHDTLSVSSVILLPDPPPHSLMIRITPIETQGMEWYRPEPAAERVRVAWAARRGELVLQQTCVRVALCALALKPDKLTRVFRSVGVKNVGEGSLEVSCRVVGARGGAQWVVRRRAQPSDCGATLCEPPPAHQQKQLDINLPPRATTELILEVAVGPKHGWPVVPREGASGGGGEGGAGARCCVLEDTGGTGGEGDSLVSALPPPPPPAPPYERLRVYNATLQFYDDYSLLQELPLIVEIEVPALEAHPPEIDFNYVCDGDTRKQYFTAWHTSKTETLTVKVEWSGDEHFRTYPPTLTLRPGQRQNVYVQYTARYMGGQSDGVVMLSAGGGGGGAGRGAASWCRRGVRVLARAVRDFHCHRAPHDFTDDPHLLPPPLNPHWYD